MSYQHTTRGKGALMNTQCDGLPRNIYFLQQIGISEMVVAGQPLVVCTNNGFAGEEGQVVPYVFGMPVFAKQGQL